MSDYDAVQVKGQRDAGKCSAVRLVTVTPPLKEWLPETPTTEMEQIHEGWSVWFMQFNFNINVILNIN